MPTFFLSVFQLVTALLSACLLFSTYLLPVLGLVLAKKGLIRQSKAKASQRKGGEHTLLFAEKVLIRAR
jgi:hypothetical protein